MLSELESSALIEEYATTPNRELIDKYHIKRSWLEKFATNHKLRKVPGLQFPSLPVGYKSGKLTVKTKTTRKEKNNYIYECECECGNTVCVRSQLLRRKKVTQCGRCSSVRFGIHHHRRGGFGPIGGKYWSRTKAHANERGIAFLITVEEGVAVFEKQGGRCALSGLPIAFPERFCEVSKGTASLDRIDSTKPYTQDNVQWVHKIINFMKHILSQEDFISYCHAVAKHNPKPEEPTL